MNSSVTRRSVIQQIIYTIIALVFGPEALARLDLQFTERLVDDVMRPPWLGWGWGAAKYHAEIHQLILGVMYHQLGDSANLLDSQ